MVTPRVTKGVVWIIMEVEYTQPAFTYSKLTIETLGQGVKYGVFMVKFEHIPPHLVLVFLLLTLNM